MTTKRKLRTKYKTLRESLSEETIARWSLDIANRLLELPIWGKNYYHIFLSIQQQKEVNTGFILHILQGKDKNVIVSKSNFTTISLEHILLTDATKFQINMYGIPEPTDGVPVAETLIDVVFIPLLAYDIQGNRVGYGKGFYDLFLQKCRPDCLKIGLSFFEPEVKIEDTFPGDIPLDYCVTPERVYNY